MQALAQTGNGTAAYIDTANEARKVRKFLRQGGTLEASDPLASVLRKVWMLQLRPASPRLH